MSFRLPRHRILEIVKAPKAITSNHSLELQNDVKHNANFDVPVELTEGAYCDLRYLGRAGRKDKPETFDASFLIEQQRVRGIGYCPVARNNFRAKLRIPAGWHQNICDPNMPTHHAEWNRHEALPNFAPADFYGFVRSCAELWSIDLLWEEELL